MCTELTLRNEKSYSGNAKKMCNAPQSIISISYSLALNNLVINPSGATTEWDLLLGKGFHDFQFALREDI